MKLKEQDLLWYNESQERYKLYKEGIKLKILTGSCFYDEAYYELSPYVLVTDPQYGFQEQFLKPGSPWHETFKKFMDTQGDNDKRGDDKCTFVYENDVWKLKIIFSGLLPINAIAIETVTTTITLPKKMLTGHIIDYLRSERA